MDLLLDVPYSEKDEAKTYYNDSISKISYSDNMILNNTSDSSEYLFKINFTNNMLGKYKIVWHNATEFGLNDDMINNNNFNPTKLFESYYVNREEMKIEGIINVTKAQNYYFGSKINSGDKVRVKYTNYVTKNGKKFSIVDNISLIG